MSTKMLIDAAHPEETRVVVVRDGKVEEFDFEAAARKQLRGNIYLAKVTRVEPSLQAAFVDYGGNRHGFLAFSEIHPDYYQIPFADRQALIEEESVHADDDDGDEPEATPAEVAEAGADSDDADNGGGSIVEVAANGEDTVESMGGDDAIEEAEVRSKRRHRRSYKIQEVIKKRQVLLIQVVKEERGNKGAALTTYLSLAGRYSVLMPNTARGGGISRKITSATDRKRLKTIVTDLDVPEGMGVILRTAGASRTKAEVKRDFEYLLRLWENVRELTLESVAPSLVYEEGSLVKRAIRDLYTKDIDQVLINGDGAYREAKDFMRMLMPSHARNIQPYRDAEPIFSKHNVEGQLDAMFSPQVTLKSGGYVVINQTEALVAIDVNSGRSTREHNIEDTALKTNLEAADEVARQLRLRDLAGLIVIDFIDMEEKRNNRNVERRLKEALKNDRARIQVGRISHFGLLEMSRQRMRFGVLESSLQPCPHCEGTGRIRSTESVALHVLRSIEYELRRARPTDLTVRVRTAVALYILNQKRGSLRELEALGVTIAIEADEHLGTAMFKLEKGEPARMPEAGAVVRPVSVNPDEMYEDAEEQQPAEAEAESSGDDEDDGRSRRRKRRRRGRRGSGGEDQEAALDADSGGVEAESDAERDDPEHAADGGDGSGGAKKRRRGRRGGRRHRRDGETRGEHTREDAPAEAEAGGEGDQPAGGEPAAEEPAVTDEPRAEPAVASADAEPATPAAEAEPAPRKRRAPRKRKTAETAEQPAGSTESPAPGNVATEDQAESTEKPKPPAMETEQAGSERQPEPAEAARDGAGDDTHEAGEEASPRRGWWQRRGLFGGR